eukprot:TCALIF_06340-PA protein Name:"Similar to HNRNPUL1 Heterogeneous nuclear ribonucleoprotein U-like protein 1 (Homo sapiens)" AED:0.04 eAED:0.04 QI:0/0.57/0.37/0.87/0.85/1/8/0/1426
MRCFEEVAVGIEAGEEEEVVGNPLEAALLLEGGVEVHLGPGVARMVPGQDLDPGATSDPSPTLAHHLEALVPTPVLEVPGPMGSDPKAESTQIGEIIPVEDFKELDPTFIQAIIKTFLDTQQTTTWNKNRAFHHEETSTPSEVEATIQLLSETDSRPVRGLNVPTRIEPEPVKPSRWSRATAPDSSSVSLPGPAPASFMTKPSIEKQQQQQQPQPQQSLEVAHPNYETFPSTSKAVGPAAILPQADLPRPIPSQDLVAEERKPRQPALPNEDEPNYDDSLVILDWYNSDLNLIIDKNDYCSAVAMSHEGFGLMWAGARATYGVCRGRACFEVRIDGNCNAQHLENEPTPHVLRVGWSIDEASMQLGEDPFSYGYGGTGKKAVGCTFTNYGVPFGVGDVVACYVDFNCEPVQIGYTLNGRNLGPAFHVTQSDLQGRALFPHILTKNQNFTVNFGQLPAPMSGLLPDYPPIGQLDVSEGLVRGALAPSSRSDCEVLLMIGLPGAGKTFWATEHSKSNPKKRYQILGTNNLLERMKVQGLPRKRNYHGRWDVLISKCTRCFDELLKIATRRRRNYILDQTNVFPTARSRKFKDFTGFTRKAIVVVPENAEYLRRVSVREMAEGKEVPDDAVLSMKANFVLPDLEETYFDEVLYTEMEPQDAQILVYQYNEEARRRGVDMTQSVKCFIQRNKDKRQTIGKFEMIGRSIKIPKEQHSIIKPTGIPANGPPAPVLINSSPMKQLNSTARSHGGGEGDRQNNQPPTRNRRSKSRERKRSRSHDRRNRKRTRSRSKSRDHRREEPTRSRDRSSRRRTRSPEQSRHPFTPKGNAGVPSPWAQNQAGPMGNQDFNPMNMNFNNPPQEGILGSRPQDQPNDPRGAFQPGNFGPNEPSVRSMSQQRQGPDQFTNQQGDHPPGPFQQYGGPQQSRFSQERQPRERQGYEHSGGFNINTKGPTQGNIRRDQDFTSDNYQIQRPFQQGNAMIEEERGRGPVGNHDSQYPDRSSQFDPRNKNSDPRSGPVNATAFRGDRFDRNGPGASRFGPPVSDTRNYDLPSHRHGSEPPRFGGPGPNAFEAGNESFQGGSRPPWNKDKPNFEESRDFRRYGNPQDPRGREFDRSPGPSSRQPQNSRWAQDNYDNDPNWNKNRGPNSQYQNSGVDQGPLSRPDPRFQGHGQKPWDREPNSDSNNRVPPWQQRPNNQNPDFAPNAREVPPHIAQGPGPSLNVNRSVDDPRRNWNQSSDDPQYNQRRPFEGQGPNWNYGSGPRPFEDPRNISGRNMPRPDRNPQMEIQDQRWGSKSDNFHDPSFNARNADVNALPSEWNRDHDPDQGTPWTQRNDGKNWNASRDPNWNGNNQGPNWNQRAGPSTGPEHPHFNATSNVPNSPAKSDSASSSRSNEGQEGETSSGPAPDYKALLNYLQFYQKQMGGNSKDGPPQ